MSEHHKFFEWGQAIHGPVGRPGESDAAWSLRTTALEEDAWAWRRVFLFWVLILGVVFFFFFSFIEVYLIYNILLISAIEQSDSVIRTYSFSYSFPLWFITGYWVEFPVLYSRTFCLFILYTGGLKSSFWKEEMCSKLWTDQGKKLCFCHCERVKGGHGLNVSNGDPGVRAVDWPSNPIKNNREEHKREAN